MTPDKLRNGSCGSPVSQVRRACLPRPTDPGSGGATAATSQWGNDAISVEQQRPLPLTFRCRADRAWRLAVMDRPTYSRQAGVA